MQIHKTKRQLQAELTKQRILQNATKLFDEYGFENVSMEDIAKASESSIGGIYHYFSSKGEIAAYAITTYDDEYDRYYHEKLMDESHRKLTSFEKLREFMVFVQCICIKTGTLNHLFTLGLHHKDNSALNLSGERRYTQILMELIAQCRKDGFIAEAHSDDDVFKLLTFASRGLFTDWLFKEGSPAEFDMAEKTRDLIDAIFMGIK